MSAPRCASHYSASIVEDSGYPRLHGEHTVVRNDYNLHLHPLNLCLGEARAAAGPGVRIFEDSPVVAIEHGSRPTVVTADGRIRADSVIVAGNAYHRLERSKLGGVCFRQL